MVTRMGVLERRRLRRAIWSYARKLPSLLLRDYGAGRWYSAQQVRGTVERSRLSTEHLPYALLMFSEQAEFDRHCREVGTLFDIVAMRGQIGPANLHDTMEGASMQGIGPGGTHCSICEVGHFGGSHG